MRIQNGMPFIGNTVRKIGYGKKEKEKERKIKQMNLTETMPWSQHSRGQTDVPARQGAGEMKGTECVLFRTGLRPVLGEAVANGGQH